jgi:hypothetical protein
MFAPNTNQKSPYTIEIERKFPGFLHECYRYAASITGTDAQLETILTFMDEYARVHFPSCPIRSTLSMTRHHFYKFFGIFNGKYNSPTTKPRLTDKQKKQRLDWAIHWNKLKRKPASQKHFCFIDEKWFYTTSKRRKQRILPQHPITETAADAHVSKKKLRSRRFATKVMFQAIITKPYPEHNFDGKISLRRVSTIAKTKKVSYNQKFDDGYHITNLIKEGEWKTACSIDSNTTIQEVIDEIQYLYGLHEDVAEHLTFSHCTHKKNGKREIKRRYMDENGVGYNELLIGNQTFIDEHGVSQELTINDIGLSVRVPRGSEVEKDVSCDSTFMLESLEDAGTSIRSALHWVDSDDPIYLFIDNAGGHGTDEAKGEYESTLLKKYRIIVVWQVPNSPETNLLDLGFWATQQAIVERLHRLCRMDPDGLSRTVRDAFLLVEAVTISKIFKRWELVLQLIMNGKGSNELVESKRGLTKSLLTANELVVYCRK